MRHFDLVAYSVHVAYLTLCNMISLFLLASWFDFLKTKGSNLEVGDAPIVHAFIVNYCLILHNKV